MWNCGASTAATWSSAVCPPKCACSLLFSDRFQADLRTVDCSNRDLRSFPELTEIAGDAQVLLFRGNRLRSVPVLSRLPDLLHADFSGNRLVTLKTMAFESAFNLRMLDLSSNRLSELPAGAFQVRTLVTYSYESVISFYKIPILIHKSYIKSSF